MNPNLMGDMSTHHYTLTLPRFGESKITTALSTEDPAAEREDHWGLSSLHHRHLHPSLNLSLFCCLAGGRGAFGPHGQPASQLLPSWLNADEGSEKNYSHTGLDCYHPLITTTYLPPRTPTILAHLRTQLYIICTVCPSYCFHGFLSIHMHFT